MGRRSPPTPLKLYPSNIPLPNRGHVKRQHILPTPPPLAMTRKPLVDITDNLFLNMNIHTPPPISHIKTSLDSNSSLSSTDSISSLSSI